MKVGIHNEGAEDKVERKLLLPDRAEVIGGE